MGEADCETVERRVFDGERMQTFEKALVEERATVGVEQRQRVGKRRTASLEAMMLNAGVREGEVVVGVVVGSFEVVGTTLMVMRLEMKRVAKQETRNSGKITAGDAERSRCDRNHPIGADKYGSTLNHSLPHYTATQEPHRQQSRIESLSC